MIFIARVKKSTNNLWLRIALIVVIIICLMYICYYIGCLQQNKSVAGNIITQSSNSVADVVVSDDNNINYSSFYNENNDFVGWLAINDKMSFPVVKHSDNEYYLTHNCNKKKDGNGAVFLDYRNSIAPECIENRNFQIYGHNKLNGTNFSNLKKQYSDVDGWKECPVIIFNTLYSNYSFLVVGAFITNAYEQDDNNNYVFPFSLVDITGIADDYNKELQQRFLYSTGYSITENDTLLTLTTCSYDFTSARFVVIAKLINENFDVDTSKAKENANPRYPQGWYDLRRLNNPYKNDNQWMNGIQ